MISSETPLQQNGRKTVETGISSVTVYSNQALVTRHGVVALSGQERELAIALLPVTIQTESVRARGGGTVAVRLMGVSTEPIFATEPVVERVAQLTQQIQQLEEQQRRVQAKLDSLLLQHRFVQGLSEKSEDCFSRSLARKQVSLSETLELLNFLGNQYTEYGIAIGECKTQRQELDKQLQALRQQLQQVDSPRSTESFSLIVAVEPAGAGEFELEVSYVVAGASWIPLYDLRVSDNSNRINLSYLAEVIQNTGEDWTGVALTLSTAKPGLGTLPPKLQPWYVDSPRPDERRMRQRAMRVSAPAPEESFDTDVTKLPANSLAGAAKAVMEQEFIEAETVVAVSREGSVVTFRLDGNGNIPSDGAPHKITIFSDDYPFRWEYIAMPRLVSFAYLQATVTNSANGATLLPGKANIFRNNTFVGTTGLDNVAPGQEFKLNLGIDEGLKIERDLVERQVDKRLISGQRRISYAYRLVITNLQNQEASLRLTEQLPVSRNEQIKVRLSRSNPQIQVGEMGMLEWAIALPPQSQRELYYQFSVEHPPELAIVGLDI